MREEQHVADGRHAGHEHDQTVDPVREAKVIVEELRKYDESLYEKPRWLVLNKADLLSGQDREKVCRKFLRKLGWEGKNFIISAITGEGCKELTYAIMDYLEQESAKWEE